jgi:hypothetical protein
MFPGHDATQPVELEDRLLAAFTTEIRRSRLASART